MNSKYRGAISAKSGFEAAITEGSTRAVVFVTAFSSKPEVVVSFTGNSPEISTVTAHTISASGFTISVNKVGGGEDANRGVSWIAIDAGNP